MWSWKKLAETYNFRSCGILLIDAEGNDTEILASMFRHCGDNSAILPRIIQFETMGHCNSEKGPNAEKYMTYRLMAKGYRLVASGDHNTYLVKRNHLRRNTRIQEWAGGWSCDRCGGSRAYPYLEKDGETTCRKCTRSPS